MLSSKSSKAVCCRFGMEPWQYSALQAQFSSLLHLLTSNSENSRPIPTAGNDSSANGQAMNINSCNDEAHCRSGIKRKLSDSDDLDNLEHQGKGMNKASCSGETSELLRNSDNSGKPSEDKITKAAQEFLIGIDAGLKSKAIQPKIHINMEHDVWRYVSNGLGTMSNHEGHMLYAKEDFSRLMPALPSHWWYHLNELGEGKARSKKTSFKQHNGGHTKLALDVYTQTNASYVGDQNNTLAKIAELVIENARRLDGIENLLAKVERRISLLGSDSTRIDKDATKPALTVEIKPSPSLESIRTPVTPSTPASVISDVETDETTLGQSVNVIRSPMTTVGPHLLLQGIPVTAQSNPNNGWSNNPAVQQSGIQGMDSSSKPTIQDWRTESQTKGLDMNDGASNVLVPVIFASEDKTRRCTTAEVALQDLLNGNVTNPEDSIQIFRGCWFGDRLDPHSRVWYYGDFKVIQRAEASGSNPAKLSLNLLEALFTREEMASSNVNGARGRDLLDPIKIKAIYAHINYKYPTDPDKQELRWHFLKPRIDSKCRAQRRIQRDHQAVGDAHQSNKERPFRSKLNKPSLDPKIKEELLYGLVKTDSGSSVASQVVNGSRATADAGNLEMRGNVQTSTKGQTSLVCGNNTL